MYYLFRLWFRIHFPIMPWWWCHTKFWFGLISIHFLLLSCSKNSKMFRVLFFLSEQRSTFLLTEYFLRSETYATLEDFLSLVEDYLDISLHCLVEWLVTLVQIISHCASCVGCTKFLYKWDLLHYFIFCFFLALSGRLVHYGCLCILRMSFVVLVAFWPSLTFCVCSYVMEMTVVARCLEAVFIQDPNCVRCQLTT